MTDSMGHMLIGPPGCGKSTLARHWVQQCPDTVWVSTDAIRKKLYGDACIQGDWPTLETQLLQQIQDALDHQHSVLYDATNAHPDWRVDFLQKVHRRQAPDTQAQWMGWVFQTPLAVCHRQNQMRNRQVDKAVIEQFHHWLAAYPPSTSEGFAAIHPVPITDDTFDFEMINRLIHRLQL